MCDDHFRMFVIFRVFRGSTSFHGLSGSEVKFKEPSRSEIKFQDFFKVWGKIPGIF